MAKVARLYRMYSDEHICPFGIRTRALLERKGYEVDDHLLRSRQETEQFKQAHDVETTPQVYIEGERIGGFEATQDYFGIETDEDETSYAPVLYLFAVAFLAALALTWNVGASLSPALLLKRFVALAMILLAAQKLRDIESFLNSFVTYDLLAQRYPRYGYVYPFAEAIAGVGMLSAVTAAYVAPIALFIGAVGGISVFKAVYIDKRELTCACVGGDSNVPLGAISLTENVAMVGMALWMFAIHAL